MKYAIKHKWVCVFFIFFVVLFTGCSDVSFGEADPNNQKFKSGKFTIEYFKQGLETKKLDVLVIVDNSGSMSDEQKKLGDRIDSFLDTLVDIDWQLGVTTTDVSDGAYGLKGDLLKFTGTDLISINKNVPNYSGLFLNTIVRPESYNCSPECPSGNEQPLKAAILAMDKSESTNKGFYRDGADLGILVLSDEDEMSNGASGATTAEDVLNFFNSKWQEDKKLYSYGMVVVPGDSSCLSKQGGQGRYGTFVEHFALITGGLVGSICEADYAPTLGLLANHAKKLTEYITLKYYPDIETVKIKLIPEFNVGYSVQGKRIYFDNPPPKETEIIVDYKIK